MSFSRWGKDSDVYTFVNGDDEFECCGCTLLGGMSATFKTPKEFVNHLKRHKKLGDKVPKELLDERMFQVRP